MNIAVSLRVKGESAQCEIHALPEWEHFDKLLAFLVKYYDAKVFGMVDGPDARSAEAQIGLACIRVTFESPWGCSLSASTSSGVAIVETISNDLKRRLG